jgi:uncharacterized protein YkwD
VAPDSKSVTNAKDLLPHDPLPHDSLLHHAPLFKLFALLTLLLATALLLIGGVAPAYASAHARVHRREAAPRVCHTRGHHPRPRACLRSIDLRGAHTTDGVRGAADGVRGVRHARKRKSKAGARSLTQEHTVGRNTERTTPTAAQAQAAKAATIASVLATPCTNTEVTPTPQNIEAVTSATLCLINQERARNGELPLQESAQLAHAAVEHSEEMVSKDYFAHVAPDGSTPLQRVEATGYIPNHEVGYTIGENIAWGTLQLSTPAAIVAAWIASPEHLANILDPSYKETGLGVVAAVPPSLSQGQPGAIYSQVFGVIVYG